MSMHNATGRAIPAEICCVGKVGFVSQTLAADVVSRKGSEERRGRTVYHCTYCGLWHVGGNMGSQKKRVSALKELKRHE